MNERREILQQIIPFSLFTAEALEAVSLLLEEKIIKRDGLIYRQDKSRLKGLDIVVDGAMEAFFDDGPGNRRFVEKYPPLTCFADDSLLVNRKNRCRSVIARKETTIWTLNKYHFQQLCQSNPGFFEYFILPFGRKMMQDEYAYFINQTTAQRTSYIANDFIYSRTIEHIKYREIVSCAMQTPVYEAASMMAEKKVSCLFVKDSDGLVQGYVTDITLRDNVIAKRRSAELTVKEVMDTPVETIRNSDYVFEAILKMFQTRSRYLLVSENGQVSGYISRSRLLSEQTESPLLFIQSVRQTKDPESLRQKWQEVPRMMEQLLDQGIASDVINEIVSSVSDTIGQKVVEGIIDKIGPAPARFAMMVLGSEGRKEQTLMTDQDNALIYEDVPVKQRKEVREWFMHFGQLVSSELHEIGFHYCSGGYMVSNPQWNHSLSHWKQNYNKWIDESVPETAMNITTFFDGRLLYGEMQVMTALSAHIKRKLSEKQERLFFFIARNALRYDAPLTFFKNIKTFTVGKNEVIDIKKTMAAIVDIIRLYALRNDITVTNTGARMKKLREDEFFSEAEYLELSQGYYFLMSLRLKHQTKQLIRKGQQADNFLPVKELSKIEQAMLLAVFKTIEKFQAKVRIRFNNTL